MRICVVGGSGVVRHVLLSSPVAELREQVLRDRGEKTLPGWRSPGTVKNPGDSPESLLITAFFTDKHTTASDFAQTTVQLGAETQVRWGAEKPFSTTPTMRCASTGTRKRVKQPGTAKGLCRLDVYRNRSVCS